MPRDLEAFRRYQKEYRANHREKQRAYEAEWRKTHRDKRNAYIRERYAKGEGEKLCAKLREATRLRKAERKLQPPPTSKTCIHCNGTKPVAEFSTSRPPSYTNAVCAECRRQSSRKRVAACRAKHLAEYRESERLAARAKREKDREKDRAIKRSYRNNNIAKVRAQEKAVRDTPEYRIAAVERTKAWMQKHPGAATEFSHARRARRLKTSGRFTAKEFTALCSRYGGKCLCCGVTGIKLTADHVIPLSFAEKPGYEGIPLNAIGNIQPLCKSCNSKKNTKHIDYRPTADILSGAS
jgi:5-methylcytosine-specific restriction endonuclease McrA